MPVLRGTWPSLLRQFLGDADPFSVPDFTPAMRWLRASLLPVGSDFLLAALSAYSSGWAPSCAVPAAGPCADSSRRTAPCGGLCDEPAVRLSLVATP